jgi:hypothetical protein
MGILFATIARKSTVCNQSGQNSNVSSVKGSQDPIAMIHPRDLFESRHLSPTCRCVQRLIFLPRRVQKHVKRSLCSRVRTRLPRKLSVRTRLRRDPQYRLWQDAYRCEHQSSHPLRRYKCDQQILKVPQAIQQSTDYPNLCGSSAACSRPQDKFVSVSSCLVAHLERDWILVPIRRCPREE